jgi:cardiolipin synthase
VATTPNTGSVYRVDQQIAALARKSLWLTDAYYVGTTPYTQVLKAAATDGVDVRLLIPGATDIPIVRTISRAGYNPLLEAGVRLFEWNGSMIHAKTAVADGYWARVGSTNLNLASWIGNYELDAVVENEEFSRKMEAMYLADLENATEIVLTSRYRKKLSDRDCSKQGIRFCHARGSIGRVGAGAIRIGNTVGAAITNRRVLGPAEARIPLLGGAALFLLAILFLLFPRWVITPVAVMFVWFGLTLLIKAWRLHRIQLDKPDKDEEDTEREGNA